MKYLYVLLVIFTFSYSQDKDIGRYQIIQVDKISGSEHTSTNVTSLATATANKTIFLLDTKLGRCWILTPISSDAGNGTYDEDFEWMPVSYLPIKDANKNEFFPPKIK